MKSICRLAQTSKTFHAFADVDSVWKEMYHSSSSSSFPPPSPLLPLFLPPLPLLLVPPSSFSISVPLSHHPLFYSCLDRYLNNFQFKMSWKRTVAFHWYGLLLPENPNRVQARGTSTLLFLSSLPLSYFASIWHRYKLNICSVIRGDI